MKRINLNTDWNMDPKLTGVEYRIPWGCSRKFDDGSQVWFFIVIPENGCTRFAKTLLRGLIVPGVLI